MNLIDKLKALGVLDFKQTDSKLDEVWRDVLEMGQLKSNFDMEKFTVAREGPFRAHQFHFLMRQYGLALTELAKFQLDKEEKLREIGELQNQSAHKVDGKYVDIELRRKQNEIKTIEMSIVSKASMVIYFEQLRRQLKKQNGQDFTNEQYQEEMPGYWKWFLENKAKEQIAQGCTGIHEGVWENIRFMEAPAPLNPEFQVKMLNSKGVLELSSIPVEDGGAQTKDFLPKLLK